MRTKFLGVCDSFYRKSLLKEITVAYSEGYNSLFVVGNGSFHDYTEWLYAQKRTTGRKVKNPQKWIEGAMENCEKKSSSYWKMVRE